MSGEPAGRTGGVAPPSRHPGALPTFPEIVHQVLRPPLRDRRFWVIQGLILGIVAGHVFLDVRGAHLPGGLPDYPTVGLLLLPVIYSALKFGLGGASASAAWGSLLMLPDLLIIDTRADLLADATLLAITWVGAVAVGQRVERETVARRRADAAVRAHSAAEARYRALFEAGLSPTLVVDGSGGLREANPAAKALFGDRVGRRRLSDLLGESVARQLLAQTPPKLLTVTGLEGFNWDLRPLSTLLTDGGGDPLLQIILQDVTEDAQRQRITESYALQTLHLHEDERRRIGQDIHDDPLQTLIYLARRLEAATQESELSPVRRTELEGVHQGLVAVVLRLRELADGLRPPALDDLSLEASLRQLLTTFARRSELAVAFRVRGVEPELTWDRRTDLFRIVQEGIRNVERHSGAHRVTVEVSFSSRTLRARICDDGCGFRPEEHEASPGLRAMRERASLAGGQLEVESAPGQGTVIRLSMPTLTRLSERSGNPVVIDLRSGSHKLPPAGSRGGRKVVAEGRRRAPVRPPGEEVGPALGAAPPPGGGASG
ncbi:MAG: ATP-binding protein [Candidatus Dormiibacterota bacterium]